MKFIDGQILLYKKLIKYERDLLGLNSEKTSFLWYLQ